MESNYFNKERKIKTFTYKLVTNYSGLVKSRKKVPKTVINNCITKNAYKQKSYIQYDRRLLSSLLSDFQNNTTYNK